MTSTPEEEYYNSVNKLPTDKCRLNISDITSNRTRYGDLCRMKGKEHLNDEQDFIDHCVNVTSYIGDFDKNCPINDNPKRCKFFNYTLNEEVRNKRYTKYKDVMLINAYKAISSEMQICKDDVEFIQNEVFTKINDLYNMNYKFKKILNDINASRDVNCSEVNNSVALYKRYKSVCNKRNRNIFCNKLDDFKSYYIRNIAQILPKCPHIEVNLPSFGIIGAEGDESEMQDAFHDSDDVFSASGLGFSRSNILIGFSSLLLISFIMFILYKFTPVGPWILPQIRNMKQNLNNIFKEILHFFYKSKTQRINTQKNQINLQYLSLENE